MLMRRKVVLTIIILRPTKQVGNDPPREKKISTINNSVIHAVKCVNLIYISIIYIIKNKYIMMLYRCMSCMHICGMLFKISISNTTCTLELLRIRRNSFTFLQLRRHDLLLRRSRPLINPRIKFLLSKRSQLCIRWHELSKTITRQQIIQQTKCCLRTKLWHHVS